MDENYQSSEVEQVLNVLGAVVSDKASWFYWIAGLSLINYGIYAFGGNTRFIIGLGISELATAHINSLFLAIGVNVLITIIFLVFGALAAEGSTWAFIIGMTVYALDALIFIPLEDYLSIGFHLFALYYLFRGLLACTKLNKVRNLVAYSESVT